MIRNDADDGNIGAVFDGHCHHTTGSVFKSASYKRSNPRFSPFGKVAAGDSSGCKSILDQSIENHH